MQDLYEKPQAEELLLAASDPIALSIDDGEDNFSGGVPFGLRDPFEVFEE